MNISFNKPKMAAKISTESTAPPREFRISSGVGICANTYATASVRFHTQRQTKHQKETAFPEGLKQKSRLKVVDFVNENRITKIVGI